jgi:hypothetical protein
MKGNDAVFFYGTQFSFYCCCKATCIAIMNLNQPTATYIIICVSLVFHHPTEFVLSSAHL